jgi:uncharacterized damage-inducible protein DinB
MSFDAAGPPVPHVDEREVLLGFIRWQREQVVATVDGLSEQELRWTPGDRLLPIIGVVNHLTHMEWRWVEGRYLGSEFPSRHEEFSLGTEVTGAEVVDAYWRQAQRTETVVRAAPNLEAPCLGDEGGRGPAHVLLGFTEPVDLRWVLLHVLEETAHHAGHADSTREMLDGKKMRG